MDYLDPRKRRAHNQRLVVGYFLIGIVIILATYLLNQAANGYGVNVKTGQIIQNALLFADSHPGGAEIYLNGHDKNTSTAARLILPAGNYTLTLKKDGYRDWSRHFILSEQSVARYVYPFLFPDKPLLTNLKTHASLPGLVTESPDRHWLMVQSNEASAQVPAFDVYDTGTLDQTTPVVQQIAMPANLLSNYSANSKLTKVEWSTDNNNVLLKHNYDGGSEFIVFNRAHPDQSFNVDRMFNSHPAQVALYDKKASQLYIYNQDDQTLRLGDTGRKTLGTVLASHVLAFKPYGRNLITYITDNNEPKGMAAARIFDSGKSYKLNEFPIGNTYLIDAAQFQGDFYYVAGSDTSDHLNIYKNPLDQLKNPASAKALPIFALRINGAQKIAFSDNTQFIAAQSGQQLAVYDFQNQEYYEYTVADPLAGILDWMDGDRLIGVSNGKVFIIDYDGTNKQLVADTSLPDGALFSRNYDHMLTISHNQDGSAFNLFDIDMRAGKDLPNNKQQ